MKINEIIINKSRFIGIKQELTSEKDIEETLNAVKKEHKNATHICYAYVYSIDKVLEKCTDDGEPKGTAGAPIMGVIKKRGAKNVIMTDIDECAIVATNHNMALNGVENGVVMLKNLLDDNTVKGDVIVCNIMAEVLIAFANYIGANLLKKGVIILSGILVERLPAVRKAYLDAGFTFIEEKVKGEWSALVMGVGQNK